MYHAGYSGSGLGSDGVSMDGYGDLGNMSSLRSGGFLGSGAGQTPGGAPIPPIGLPGTSPAPGMAYDDSGQLISLATPAPAKLAPLSPRDKALLAKMGDVGPSKLVIAVAAAAVLGAGWWFMRKKG